MSHLAPPVLLVGAMAVAFAACGKADKQTCQRAAETQYCLVENNGAYKATGSGFQPGSEVHVTVDDTAAQVTRAASDGTLPGQGSVMGVLEGPERQRLTVTGTTSRGEEVRFEFTIPPAGR
jgi:hypothetical protein